VGDHEVQLAFPELMARHEVESAPLIERVEAHLEALARLAEHHEQTARADHARAEALRAMLQAHPDTPIIAFSQFTHTIGALHRALSDIAGVGLLSSKHARIASGRISRSDALARFAPRAQERPPPPAHQAIRLLLATDLLAEGVNLQDAGVVVHLDLPWTDALREQRVGRCARLGSPHREVHVYAFAPHADGDRALRLQRRLVTKAALSRRFAGGVAVHRARERSHERSHERSRRGSRESAADAASRLHARLQLWAASDAATASSRTVVGAVRSDRETAWLALVDHQGQSRLLCSHALRTTDRRRVVSARVRSLLRVATIADAASTASVSSSAELAASVEQALRDIRRWHARAAARDAVGPTGQAVAPLAQRVARHLAQLVQRCGPIERAVLREAIADAEWVVGRARGTGAEEAMARWCAQAEAAPWWTPKVWLTAWQQEPVLAGFARDRSPVPEVAPITVARVTALLLIGPDYPLD
jgi:superfamily II DNA/RNA helicase